MEDFMLPCLNKKLFGIECMGCGMQRSIALVFQGKFQEAFYMYPAIYLIIPLFLILTVSLIYKFKYSNKIISILAILTIATIIVSYLIKLIN
ncbi:MAG: hypothetical protein B7Z06_11870 [Flavobacteriales bacterium 32-35-8]|nr:MAG: hypothetical protein B7Z06_11870 [Flavobacteriales bacterium 32-35-8]